MMASHSLVLLASALALASSGFVPACMLERCSTEAAALGDDAYTAALTHCAADGFGPCAGKAWSCLGDAACRSAVECAPRVLDTCKADLWKLVTDPAQRKLFECTEACKPDAGGKWSPLCVVSKCGFSGLKCLFNASCRRVLECAPRTMLECSKTAFQCVFGQDGLCRENLECVGHGLGECAAPGVNFLTDRNVANFITCAGSKCPHPANSSVPLDVALADSTSLDTAPSSTSEQAMCIAAKCGAKAVGILIGQDTRELLTCMLKDEVVDLCSSVWGCLGDAQCKEALSCWSKPFDTCKADLWGLFTVDVQRRRIEDTASCLLACEQRHQGDLTRGAFCALDACGERLLACSKDAACRGALECLPGAAAACALPQLDAYVHQELFRNSTKCVGQAVETCGRAAVEMLRDQDVAAAVQCAAQCTRTPELPQRRREVVVV